MPQTETESIGLRVKLAHTMRIDLLPYALWQVANPFRWIVVTLLGGPRDREPPARGGESISREHYLKKMFTSHLSTLQLLFVANHAQHIQ